MVYHQHSYAEAAIRKLQVKLVNAQKFVISNDLIDHAIEASLSRPYVLNQMIKLCQDMDKAKYSDKEQDSIKE